MDEKHPLEGRDEWECYDQHIAERNRLIESKRNAEDSFIKTVIQLSSAIALLVPGFILTQPVDQRQPSVFLVVGLAFIFLSLVAGLSEQFLSSLAYGKQIKKIDDYYTKLTADVAPPALSKIVGIAIFVAFVSFMAGVILTSISLLIGPWR